MAYGVLISGFFSQAINSWPNYKLLGYGYFQQLRDILPAIMLAFVAGGISWITGYLHLPLMGLLLFQVFSGIIVYVILSWLCHIESLDYIWKIIKTSIVRIKLNFL